MRVILRYPNRKLNPKLSSNYLSNEKYIFFSLLISLAILLGSGKMVDSVIPANRNSFAISVIFSGSILIPQICHLIRSTNLTKSIMDITMHSKYTFLSKHFGVMIMWIYCYWVTWQLFLFKIFMAFLSVSE